MKAALWLAGFLVLAALFAYRSLGPAVDADADIRVIAPQPLRILLPAEPDAATIRLRLVAILEQTANASGSGVLADEIRRITGDTDRLDAMANTAASKFSSNEAAALAYPLYGVAITDEGNVTVTAITAEMVPQHLGVAYSIQHEDGHAYINEALARECARDIVVRQAERGMRGTLLEYAIIGDLHELGDEAHEVYHLAVNYVPNPQYRSSAEEAADTVVAARC